MLSGHLTFRWIGERQGTAPQTNALAVRVERGPPCSTVEETDDERGEGLTQGHTAELRLEPRILIPK